MVKSIPARPLIPIITDLLEYKQAARNTIAYTKKMADKYGDVCEVSFTGVKNYFIHDPAVIKEILTTHGNKMKRTYLFRAFRKFLGNGLFTTEGEHHRQQRRLVKPALYPERVQEYARVMVECAETEIEHWKDGSNINVQESMTRITLRVITRCMFGPGMSDTEIASVSADLKLAFDITGDIVSNPVYAFCLIHDIKIPIVSKFYKQKRKLDAVISKIIAASRKDDTADKKSLLNMLLEAKDEDTGLGMTDEQVMNEVMTFFVAGHETTTIALTWTLYLLAKDKEAKSKFLTEVRALPQRPLTAEDYQLLPYTKNVFKESLRLYPPAWTFAREPTEDITIGDYHFPKGCVLWTIIYLVHHDERYFHNAEQFIPERWDDDRKDVPKYTYFPFGGGNRMCIGEGFAWMEAILVLATIGRKFDFELPPGFTTGINTLFTLKAKDDIVMRVSRSAQIYNR